MAKLVYTSKNGRGALERLSENAKYSLGLSGQIALTMSSKQITPTHIFLSLMYNKNSLAFRTVVAMGLNLDNTLKLIAGQADLEVSEKGLVKEIFLSSESKEVLRFAHYITYKMKHVYVGTEHIMLAILKEKETTLARRLERVGLTYQTFEEALLNFATYPAGILSKPNVENQIQGEQGALSIFGRELVKMAKEGKIDPVVGREEEVSKIINILSRRKKNNPLIVGEAGVGKTALVEALAQRIADGNVPASLKDSKIVLLDVSSVLAGSKMRGDVEEKMMAIVSEVTSSPDIILFIDEIHNILSSGIPGMPSDIVTVLKPALMRNEFRCIGATTLAEYRSYLEDDNAFVRRFQPVIVEETSVLETIQILKRIKPVLESHHGVSIDKRAIEQAVKLSDRYVSDRYLPDKAIDLIDEAAATRKLEAEAEYGDISDTMTLLRTTQVEKESLIKKGLMDEALDLKKKEAELQKEIDSWERKRKDLKRSKEFEVDVDTVRKVVSKWTGIPVSTLGVDEKSSLKNLENSLSKRIIGQNEAVVAVANAVKRARTGISDETRPWASFLFLGPTGVGKTELAKALTVELFGDEDRLIQIDMSEMMEMHSVSKLIGSPPGYVGYKEGGQLTEKIRQNPHSVILFDEIEKAHNDVLNILLQILEYGHLTDGKGRRVNFKNTVIVLTSNIGAEEISKDKILGFGEKIEEKEEEERMEGAYQAMKEDLTKQLKSTLRPELINRLDDIVIFRSLTKLDAKNIVLLLISDLNRRLKDHGFKITVNQKVVNYIVKEGFSEEYGARPLRRMLQEKVENVLADYILSQDEDERERKIMEVRLGLKDGEIVVKK